VRAVVITACALPLALASALPASAHVEASVAGGAQAGTAPVTLVFIAEAESTTAGVMGVRAQLPAGITPQDITLAGAPDGWTLLPTPDGVLLGGPAIGPGLDVEYSMTITRLPADSTELAFPTLQRYSDGREDAWIEPVTDTMPNPDMPAPVLTVAPAPPEATSAPTSSAAPPAQDTPSSTTQPEVVSNSAAEGSKTGTIALVAGALAVSALVAGWMWRSRRTR
jgi:hypothetical protein